MGCLYSKPVADNVADVNLDHGKGPTNRPKRRSRGATIGSYASGTGPSNSLSPEPEEWPTPPNRPATQALGDLRRSASYRFNNRRTPAEAEPAKEQQAETQSQRPTHTRDNSNFVVERPSQTYRFGTNNAIPQLCTTSPGGTTIRAVSGSSTRSQSRYYASLNMGGTPFGGGEGSGWPLRGYSGLGERDHHSGFGGNHSGF